MKKIIFGSLVLAVLLPLSVYAQMSADNGKSASGNSTAATPTPVPVGIAPTGAAIGTNTSGTTAPKSGANAAGTTDSTGATR